MRQASHLPHLGPNALEVYIALPPPAGAHQALSPRTQQPAGQERHATGRVSCPARTDLYRFYVVGQAKEGFKRDPYARELEFNGYPDCDCILRDPADYPWHDAGFRPPGFSDLIIYQFHIGVFYAKDAAGHDIRPGRVSKILDVVDRIEYFADLGVNAVMPLPFGSSRARTVWATTARTFSLPRWTTQCRRPTCRHTSRV